LLLIRQPTLGLQVLFGESCSEIEFSKQRWYKKWAIFSPSASKKPAGLLNTPLH
jgi:hypothetical protein